MVVGAVDSTQHPQASSAPVPSAEEEALKRNTDCVYFLASPLTCKKGSECEYRHSDYARVNPRDCWYWLNGNCLNRKCAFRHPPLDGLLGGQASASGGASLPPQQVVVPPPVHNSYSNSGRQPVPCIFFQKGFCMKGDKCSFLHGTNQIGNSAMQATTIKLTGDLSSSKKLLPIFQNCSQEQKVPANSSKPPSLQVKTKPVLNAQNNNALRYEIGPQKPVPLAGSIDEEASRSSHPSPTVKESSQIRSRLLHQTLAFNERNIQNDKETEEHLRESSPGFDVLVDDELGDSGYFLGEDHFGRMGTHDQRNLSSVVTEYDMDHPSDYDSLHAVDREMMHDLHTYESYQMSGQFGWDQPQNSLEIISEGLPCREGRDHHVKGDNRDLFDGSDLRNRLSKQRRVNGLRSVVGNNYVPESHVGEGNHQESSRRHAPHAPFQESSLSGRLKGRIRFPGRSAVDEREMDMERSRGRVQRGRLSDRLKGRLHDGSSSIDGRLPSDPWSRRDIQNNDGHFAGPKSLSELKSKGKQFRSNESALQDQQGDVDLSFEGPKPLSVLLKRKREGNTSVAASEGGPSVNMEEVGDEINNSRVVEGHRSSGVAQVQGSSPQAKEDGLDILPEKGKEPSPGEEEGGMDVEDAGEENELYGDDLQDGDYDYEQADDVEYNDDVVNADEEYLDDEDGDDFAKKVGVVLT